MRAKTSEAERERDKERKRKGEGRERERQREKEAQPAAAAAAEGSDEVRSRDERAEPLARSIERSYHLCHAAVAVAVAMAVAATATAVVVPHHVEHSPWLMRASVHTSTTTIIHTPYHSTSDAISRRAAPEGGLEQRSHVECRHAE